MTRKFTVAVVSLLVAGHVFAGNYTLKINGKEYELDLAKEQQLELPDGTPLLVRLDVKPIVTYEWDFFSFDHPSAYVPTGTDLGGGSYQATLTTAGATLILLQYHPGGDSASELVDIMGHHLTKNDIAAGAKVRNSPATMKLADGIRLKGKRYDTSGVDREYVRQIVGYATGKQTWLVAVQMMKTADETEKEIVSTCLKTLQLHQK